MSPLYDFRKHSPYPIVPDFDAVYLARKCASRIRGRDVDVQCISVNMHSFRFVCDDSTLYLKVYHSNSPSSRNEMNFVNRYGTGSSDEKVSSRSVVRTSTFLGCDEDEERSLFCTAWEYENIPGHLNRTYPPLEVAMQQLVNISQLPFKEDSPSHLFNLLNLCDKQEMSPLKPIIEDFANFYSSLDKTFAMSLGGVNKNFLQTAKHPHGRWMNHEYAGVTVLEVDVAAMCFRLINTNSPPEQIEKVLSLWERLGGAELDLLTLHAIVEHLRFKKRLLKLRNSENKQKDVERLHSVMSATLNELKS